MFKELEANLIANITHLLPNVGGIRMTTAEKNLQEIREGAKEISNQSSGHSLSGPSAKLSKVGRNEQCPCGSGLKYKKCGMINAPEHKG